MKYSNIESLVVRLPLGLSFALACGGGDDEGNKASGGAAAAVVKWTPLVGPKAGWRKRDACSDFKIIKTHRSRLGWHDKLGRSRERPSRPPPAALDSERWCGRWDPV